MPFASSMPFRNSIAHVGSEGRANLRATFAGSVTPHMKIIGLTTLSVRINQATGVAPTTVTVQVASSGYSTQNANWVPIATLNIAALNTPVVSGGLHVGGWRLARLVCNGADGDTWDWDMFASTSI